MSELILPAPAKLNLFLHVTGRRADGYHELQSIFQLIDWYDVLHLRLRNDGALRLQQHTPGLATEDDLILRAAHLLREATGCRQGAELRLEKNLPLGGGLGGGSSDAAAALLGLNQLWDCGLSRAELAVLGLQLGADVPVFVHGHNAWAEGVGERLSPLETLPQAWFLVLHPGVHVNTGEIFRDPALTRDSKPVTMRAFLAGRTRNDCEAVVCQRYPAIQQALDWLRKQTPTARLTGTGACVFAAFADMREAERSLKGLPPSLGQAKIARALSKTSDIKM